MKYAWLVGSLMIFIIWLIVYVFLKNEISRKEMFKVSLWTSILGFTEPLFVPKYWNPPSLFNLAHRTGFDVESIIFSFGIGGIAVVIYEWIFHAKHQAISREERNNPRHRYHFLAIISAPIIFIFLLATITINPIYSAIIAMTTGGLFAWYCRPDLKKKMIVSAFLFLGFYFLYFLALTAIYPNYVEQVWNLKALSGILIFGIPLEELLFAWSFGFLWSSIYEHFAWQKLKNNHW